ncbi:DUF58 domain-containing protein [candidate division WOR-3 bacterium]|nr:DUF58 domain-containing protein [candidate division WOR-3 bacterium]
MCPSGLQPHRLLNCNVLTRKSTDTTRLALKPELVAKLKGIDLKARLVVEGFLAGLHRSPYKGFSVEFTEHRPYMPGDELKRIDWRVYGRTDRFFIREFEEETNLRAYLLLDASGSMHYPPGTITKLDYSRWLAASLAYLLTRQKDSVGLVIFTDRINRYIPPRATGAHLRIIFRELENTKPGGDTSLGNTLHQLAERLKRRGLVIIISDLWDNQTEVLAGLRHFRARKHELLLFHIFHPDEANLNFPTPLLLRDLETGAELTVDPRLLKTRYQESFRQRSAEFKKGCNEARIDYQPLSLATPFDQALLKYLERRRRLS